MRWLLITTIGKNPGDEWIRIGIQNVIREVDPDREYILLDKESPSMRKTHVAFDKCIWCGMPVFWSQGENQNCRISWWQELMLSWPSEKKNDFMVLGAGSFFPWGRELETVGDKQQLIQSAEDVLQRSFCVTARDEIVPRVTERPIPPIICPAIFSILDYKKSHELKLANIMPNGAHYTSFGPREAAIWNEKKHRISDILRNNGFVFVAHSLAEFQFAQKCGWEKIIPYNGDPYGLLEYYGRCGKYFGNRVHGAIIARGNDAEAWSVGYDSRQEAVRLSGARVSRPSELNIDEIEDWAHRDIKIEPFDMKSNFEKHVDIVRRCTLAGNRPLSDKLDINHDLEYEHTKKTDSTAVNISSNLFNNLCNDISTKQRVLNIISRLTRDHWLEKNIEMFTEAIEHKTQWFETLSFLNWYADTFKPGNYLEIGVRRGRSMAQVMAQSPQTRAYGFDLWIQEYSGTPNPGANFVISELKNLQVRNLPTLTEGDSHEMLPGFWADPNNPRQFELILVDGDHSYEGAKKDLEICLEHLAPGGALVFDDITHHSHPELKHLWQEYKARFADYIFIEHSHGHGTGIAFKPPFTKLEQYLRRSSMLQQPRHALSRQRNILLVRPDSIGDYVIFSGVLEHFREIYKDARIHILLQEHIAELAQNCPYIDEVITFDRKKLVHDQAYSDRIIEELKSRKFDVAINSVYSRDEAGDYLTLNSGADTTIASAGDESNMPPDKKLANDSAYTRLIPASDESMLETVRNVEFISGLAGRDFGRACMPEVWTKEEDEAAVEKLLKDLNVEHPIVICPFSQWVIKDWPLWKWSQLVSKYQDYPILFCGSQKDSDNTNELIRTLNHNNVHNLCGRLTLRQLAALLKKSRLCLGVDTATIHIAAAVGCTQVVIVGGGHFGRFMPYSPLTSVVCLPLECIGCGWKCRYEKPYCISDVARVVIAEAVQQSFEKTKDMPRVFVQSASMWDSPTTGPKWAPFDRFLDTSKVEIITVDGMLQTDEERSPTIEQNIRKATGRPDRDRYPKISIVTPSYNQKDYLEECICSILDQAYPNLEYIIMDGGSTDGSVEIIKKYANYLTYWQSEPDDGQYAAINEGFKRTTGEIMTWLNSDDKFYPNAFRTVVSIFMHRKDVEWIMGRPNTFKEQGQQRWIARSLPLWSREKYLKKEYKFIQQEGTFWQRSLWEKSGATLQTDLELAGDLELWARFFRFAQLHTIDALIAGYRYHPGQKAQVFMDKYIRESEKVLDREILLFKEAKNKELLSAPEPILISDIREFLPSDANEINQQGEDLLTKGELEGALDAFMKAIEIVPDSVVIHNNIGRLYLQKGESAKALKYFTKALKIDHHDQLSVLNCGQLLATYSKIEDARKLYRSYLQRYPDDKEMANALANLPQSQPRDLKKDRHVPSATEGTVEVLDDKYLVSAIVSTYNSENFLRGCLDDLEQQTIADKLQIIIVNSGSEENEEAIVREFQQKYDNIVYTKTEQREGIYAAWNRAVNIAQGTFVTNANTDDRHRKDALEIMAKSLQENPDIALVYGDQICTDTPNGTFDRHHSKQIAKRPEYTRERLLLGCCVGSQPMWRKSLHSEIGLFDETLSCAGDWDFWLRISSKYKFKHIPDFLGLYYYNENGIEHGSKIHSLYERYIVGKRYGTPYISVIPLYNSESNPLVTVIIPAYNAAEHIAAAIESVLIQNYRNFELLIINDGSTDNTEEIVTGFKSERIKYFRQENQGLAGAHNAGIKQSQGEFIIKLDCDDMMTPDFIYRHLQEFEKHPEADLVYCNDCLIDENSKPIRVIECPEYTDRKLLIRDLFRCGYPIVPFRTCVRKSVFDKIGFFDESLAVGEDYDMIRRFVQHGLKVHHLQDALYLRRMGFDSLSRNFNARKAKSHFEVVKRFVETFRYDELFPDVDWEKIAPERIELHAKCLVASTYLSIGQGHKIAKSPPFYVKMAFEMACEQLNDCLTIDPDNRQIHELLQKCKIGQDTYDTQYQQVVSQS